MRTCTDATTHRHQGCGCPVRPGRRAVLGLFAAAGFARGATAASGQYEAMLLNCIDPRFTTGSFLFMSSHGLRDRYSQFTIAGGPIGAVHPRFAAWHGAFWDNLDVTVQLHRIRQVMAITHRNCGAAKLAFGDAALASRAQETARHAETLAAFRAEAARRHPALAVLTAIMDLDGTIQRVG
jgi:hypothetical protein